MTNRIWEPRRQVKRTEDELITNEYLGLNLQYALIAAVQLAQA